MKTLRAAGLFLTASLVFALPGASARRSALPQGLNEGSTVKELLEYLDRTSFPHARIGLSVDLPVGNQVSHPDAGLYYPARPLVFSRGFRLASAADDCHMRLRNDDVKVYEVGGKELRPVDLKALIDAPPPYAAEFSTWLETVSHDRGKAPFPHTKDPERIRLLGNWRTEFESRGFFARDIFGVRIPALKRGDDGGEHYRTNHMVSFTFDDRQAAERFDAAFRRLIRLCQPRSNKPRWSR